MKLRFLPDIGGAYCFVIFIIMVLFAGQRALRDGDTLWHIKFGTLILEQKELVTKDFYSHTVYGQSWTSHEWLAEVIMGAIHNVGGIPGVVIFYFLIAALSYWMLFQIAAQVGAKEWLSILVVSIAVTLTISHLLARPHIFTWLLGLITLYILHKGGRRLFLLPLLMIPWANLHGGFALGLTLQGLFIVGNIAEDLSATGIYEWRRAIARQKTPAIVLFLSLAAACINPFGYKLLLFPFQVSSGSFSHLISEWMSPNLQAFWEFRLYLLLIVFLLFFGASSVSWTYRFLLLFLINAALVHSRHMSIAGIFLTPFLVQALLPFQQRLASFRKHEIIKQLTLSKVSGPLSTTLLCIFLVLGINQWPDLKKAANALIALPDKFSREAVEYLSKDTPAGNMFNYDEMGDYLIYAMDPPPKLFADGRLDMYGQKIVEDYAKIVTLEEEADELLASYEIDWVLYPPGPLIRYLEARGWRETYRDDQAVILLRTSEVAP
ncbi:hypothetical protein [Desulfuromonas sp. TF]|uniref:hypothetical protein n=1 Tax=Desulfuromonas sp. TF TaxID=1232410 RepID=UPI0004180B30|nr:hypothetical protein [Desulfuromonas sp. TF]